MICSPPDPPYHPPRFIHIDGCLPNPFKMYFWEVSTEELPLILSITLLYVLSILNHYCIVLHKTCILEKLNVNVIFKNLTSVSQLLVASNKNTF